MRRLCFTFLNIADRTWRAIADAHQAGLSYSEETITETSLLELKRDHPKNIRVKAFTKAQEAKNGSDWEWWIGGHGRWLGMRVQAKRIKYPSDYFHRLQTYKTKKMSAPQIEILINRAKADKLNPAYCLFVSSQKVPRLWATTCCRRYPRQVYMGCLVGDAVAVRATGSNKLNDLAQICHPWHCLVCDCPWCPSSGGHAPSGGRLADAAFAVLKSSRETGSEYGIEGFEGLEDFPWFAPQESLPDYLAPMLAGEGGDEPDDRLRGIAEERGLSGFVILREG